MKKKFAGLLHAAFTVFYISSVFWLSWVWVLAIFILLRLQDLFLGGCILTKLEFGTYDKAWSEHRLKSLLPFDVKYWKFFADWIFPSMLVLLAYTLQT